jgi:hypothetical protein
MLIIYDNIIFSLQDTGGISIYWAELSKRLALKKMDTLFFESQNQNIFWSDLFNKSALVTILFIMLFINRISFKLFVLIIGNLYMKRVKI